MMEINEYTVNKMTDPTGILTGERYEFRLYINLDEDDELYADGGTGLRVLFKVDDNVERIASYHFFERATEKALDFELENEEEAVVLEFCKTHLED
ncbi:DUF6509 domain-containing protein [Filibacter tadaridae]|uniref:Pullulanase n=1 Tax=Filibacter tadaridae TaxID=2483811 RepID=A0A3P5X5R1_9BACL|nr:DUF6509 family protein [Filibacter tadaridae]VDC26650.1 hypothetical protein FILTAD_01459 [Filibacter tadaridae]